MKTTLHNLLLAVTTVSALMVTGSAMAQGTRANPRFSNSGNNSGSSQLKDQPASSSVQQRPAVLQDNNGNRPGNSGSRPGYNNNNGNNNNGNRPGINNGSRPGNNSRPGYNNNNGSNNNSNRPGINNGNRPGNNARPSYNNNNGNNNSNRPGINNGNRPGNNYGQQNRPNDNRGTMRPNDNPGFHYDRNQPNRNQRPGYSYGVPQRPTPGQRNWSRPVPPPQRNRPIGRPIPRPVSSYGYHPYAGAPIISTILGVTFGTLYNTALDYLYNSGYNIDGYVDNTIYLRNVRELSLNWPDATMYYDSYGRLSSAQFMYSTSYNLLSRFDRLYSQLSRTYGPPVSTNYNGLSRVVTWYGGNAQGYVSLEYDYIDGRYYTILSYGN